MKEDKLFRNCAIGLLILVIAAYSNHFGNSFHFDDSHCILDNAYIRSLKNIPDFFKSAKTFSSLPYNQTYRPMLTALYAFDYAIGGFGSFFYHLPIFIFFLLQGICMYLLIIKLFEASFKNYNNKYFALFTTGWYMLATANSDTINYISSSSDSISTFWVVAGLVMYIYRPKWRRFCLYLIPAIIGVLFKQSAIVFPMLLAVYVFFFEKNGDQSFGKRAVQSVLASLPALILCIGLYVLQAKLTSSTYTSGGNFYTYVITQPFVILHYFGMFYFPFGLSADSDWIHLTSITDIQFIIGIIFLAILGIIAFVTLRFTRYLPISFGILWFLIALVPSTFVPLAEVMNDHRAFFPYIGLVIASGWCLSLLYEKLNTSYLKLFRIALVLILVLNAIGTFARNFVWWNEETLWHDVTIKSPNNGRGLMNYGLALMNKNDYRGADEYFRKALNRLPYYSYAYENMAILKAAEKQNDSADIYFKQALQLGSNIPAINYYYARYLHELNRNSEAEYLLKQAIAISPADIDSRYLLMKIYQEEENNEAFVSCAKETLVILPGDTTAKAYLRNTAGKKTKLQQAIELAEKDPSPANYLSLSLLYYQQKQYKKCIEYSQQALNLDPDYYLAYNNIGSSYNMTGEWENAREALTKALKLKPNFELAKSNYNVSVRQMVYTDSMIAVLKKAPTADNYLNLSLMYYKQNLFIKSIGACKEALKINPSFALAYNNICAAYNSMGMWSEAINAGEQAMRFDPNNQLIKNNLAEARKGRAGIN